MEKLLDNVFKIMDEKVIINPNFDSTIYNKRKSSLRLFFIGKNYKELSKKSFVLSKQTYRGQIVKNNNYNFSYYKTLASYSPETNAIYSKVPVITIEMGLHEVFHMATYDSKFLFGLTKLCFDKNGLKFIDFNEGATQWMTHKTLYGHDSNNLSYIVQTRILRLLDMAIPNDLFTKCFSSANFNELASAIKCPNVNKPLDKVAIYLGEYSHYERYQQYHQIDLKNQVKVKENDRYDMHKRNLLDKMQKILIDIFVSYESNNSINKINDFKEQLISSDMADRRLKFYLEKIIKDNDFAIKYFDEKINFVFGEKGKSLVKTRNNV